MESVENAKWKLQWNRINFLALLITVTVFAWVYHKGLPSSEKAIIRDRIMHKLTATAGSCLNRRNLDTSVLRSVMLGVTGISWSGFGRPALLTHSIGSCASLVCGCQEVFNHLPQGTCFIHFFERKYVCVDMCTCTIFLLSVKPVGAESPAMEILKFLVTIPNFNHFCSFSGNQISLFWWCTSHEIPEWGGIMFSFLWWKRFHVGILNIFTSSSDDSINTRVSPCHGFKCSWRWNTMQLLAQSLLSFPSPSLCNGEQNWSKNCRLRQEWFYNLK